MLVFAGITPHSPLLLPEVNKDKMHLLAETTAAMEELADDLYAAHPDVILLISEHPTVYPDAFSVNLSDPYRFDMAEFGVLSIDHTFRPEIRLIDSLQRNMRLVKQPFTLTSDEKLNFASAVPLMLLTKKLPQVKLVPLTFSELEAKDHFTFGQVLKESVLDSTKRIAVIVSGDLSHALTSESPAGFNADGEKFDQKIQELITNKNTAGMISLDKEMIKNAQQAAYRSLLILFGLLERVSVLPQILSYEAPFGVGYLVVNLALK
ncbi:MAG: class III extradiol dioxygenase subunit B-like domain-containing protein [Patescibacteria group bacterium]|nr:MEMO1 family protein [Patescibacteria group bacterium]